MRSRPRHQSGMRLCRTQAPVREVEAPTYCPPAEVFGDQAGLRGWIDSPRCLLHLGGMFGRRLTAWTVLVPGSKSEAHFVGGKTSKRRSRFVLDGLLVAAERRHCEELFRRISRDGMNGGALLAPRFSPFVRLIIDDHTDDNPGQPVIAVEYDCMRDLADGSFVTVMRLAAGFSGVLGSQTRQVVQRQFWTDTVEHLRSLGIEKCSLGYIKKSGILGFAVHQDRRTGVRAMAFVHRCQLRVGVFVLHNNRFDLERRVRLLASLGGLSLPEHGAPAAVRYQNYEGRCFTVGPVADGVVSAEPQQVAQLMVDLAGHARQILDCDKG